MILFVNRISLVKLGVYVNNRNNFVGLLLATTLLTACGGGGGGGSSSGGGGGAPAPGGGGGANPGGGQVISPFAPASIYNVNQRAFDAIKLEEAHASNNNDGGVNAIVGVLDGPANIGLTEFGNRIIAPKDFTGNDGGQDIQAASHDEQGANAVAPFHGSHVMGLVMADYAAGRHQDDRGVIGVAPKTRVVYAQVLDRDGRATAGSVGATGAAGGRNDAYRHVVANGAKVVSGSFGGGVNPALNEAATIEDLAINNDVLFVFAAGNDGADNPQAPAGLPRVRPGDGAHQKSYENLEGFVIAVGSVDIGTQGEISMSSFSNKAGDSKDWFIVAPGQSIISTTDDEGRFVLLSGTSQATPIVSGAAALIRSKWPQLTAPEVQAVLFDTAQDLGDPGVDAVFGHGLLDVFAALQPIAAASIETEDGRMSSDARQSTFVLPTAFGDGIQRSGAFDAVAAFDKYNRDFVFDLSGSVVSFQPDLIQMGDVSERGAAFIADGNGGAGTFARNIFDPDSVRFGFSDVDDASFVEMTGRRYFSFAGFNGSVGSGVEASSLNAFADAVAAETGGRANPYAGFVVGETVDVSRNITDNLQFGIAISMKDDVRYGEVGFTQTVGKVRFGLTAGAITEDGSIIGFEGEGAFSEGVSTSTNFQRAGFEYADGDLRLAAAYTVGQSSLNGNGFLTGMEFDTQSFVAGGSYRLAKLETLRLDYTEPLRVTDGQLGVSYKTRHGFDQHVVGVEPSGHERRLSVSYDRDIELETMDGSWSLSAYARTDAGHIAGEQDQGIVLRLDIRIQ